MLDRLTKPRRRYGFRCAVVAKTGANDAAGDDQANMRLSSREQPFEYPVSTDKQFEASRLRYAYDKSALNSSVLAVQDSEAWRREEIAFDGFNGERVKAFLYSPKHAKPPYQVIHFLGGGSWFYGVPVTQTVENDTSRLAPYIRAGRAVFLVVLKGFAGREPVGDYANVELGTRQHRDILHSWSVDMQRSLDYLETRSDIDARKIAFFNHSTYVYGTVFAGVDQRYSALILIGAGISAELEHVPAELNPLHFIPHLRMPKLMLNGRYDDGTPESTAEPLFRMMREPKRRAVFCRRPYPAR